MNFIDTIKSIKDKIVKSKLELQLKEAVTTTNCNITQLYDEILLSIKNEEDLITTLNYIIKKLNCKVNKWKKILKTLHMVKYFVIAGPDALLRRIMYEKYHIVGLSRFSCEINGAENIRDAAASICDLLDNERKLRKERKKFLKEKGGYGSTQPGWVKHKDTFDLTKEHKGNESSDSDKDIDLIGEEISAKPKRHNKENHVVDDINSLFSVKVESNISPTLLDLSKENDKSSNSRRSNVDLLSMTDLFSNTTPSSNTNVNSDNINLLYDFTKK